MKKKTNYLKFDLNLEPNQDKVKKASFDTMLMPIPNWNDAFKLEPIQNSCQPKEFKTHNELYENVILKQKELEELIEKSDFDDPNLEKSIKAIIGRDDRKRVTGNEITKIPYSSIGRVNVVMPSGKTYIGSGTYIGNNKILTAAHVVFDTKTNEQAVYVSFTPQKNGSSEPFGSYKATELLISQGYIDLPQYNVVYDWAVIKVDGLVGKLCPIPVAGSKEIWAQMSGRPKALSEITGYPSDKGGDKMYTHIGPAYTGNYWRISTRLDTYKGQSGGPAIYMNSENTYRNIVGVVSGEINGPNGPINWVTRLNHKDILQIWKF